MNVTEEIARTKRCPKAHAFLADGAHQPTCIGSECMLWEFGVPMFDGPDSYVAEPGPTGHCGLVQQRLGH